MTNNHNDESRESVDNFFGSHNQTKRHQLFYADKHFQEEEKSEPNSEEMLAVTIKANPHWNLYASTHQQHYTEAPPP